MSILFEDIFDVRQLNVGGKKYERISRVTCKGTTFDVDMTVDVNCELFPIKEGDRMTVAFASSINLDGSEDDGQFNPHPGPTLMDSYDYVMNGRIFKIEHKSGQVISILASFGGLLMELIGEQSQLERLEPDMKFYCLMRTGGVDTNMAMD